jgi:tetratricopeptide (TPR) repeat protein
MLDAQLSPLPDLTPSAGLELLARYVDAPRLAAEPIAAQEICDLLQNLPLAIELVGRKLAARRRRRLADMAQRLRRVGGRLELTAGNLAVRASFLVSWETLDSRLQRTFALLGLFAGRSFTAAALTHIAQGEEYLVGDQLEALGALSLVKPIEDGRYQQHSLLADFASEQLGDDHAAHLRMAGYYQSFAMQHSADYARLEPEWENLMAGMGVANRLQQWPLVLDYASALTTPWFAQGRYTQARQGYGWAVGAAQQTENEIALAQSLLRWGEACVEQNDYSEANDHFNHSLTYSKRLDEKARIADVYFYQARIELVHALYDQAEQLLHACYQLRTDIGDEAGQAAILHMQGFIQYRRGNLTEAQELCEKARAVQERTNSRTWAVPILRLMADIAMAQQQYAIAQQYCDDALDLQRTMANQSETVALYYNRTVVARLQNDMEAAYTYAEETLQLAQQMGNREHEAYALYELSQLLLKKQDYLDALQAGLQCIAQLRKIEDYFNLVYALDHVSLIYQETNQTDHAQMLLQEAVELAHAHIHPFLDTLLQRMAPLSN